MIIVILLIIIHYDYPIDSPIIVDLLIIPQLLVGII
jgi:hypothetical protein